MKILAPLLTAAALTLAAVPALAADEDDNAAQQAPAASATESGMTGPGAAETQPVQEPAAEPQATAPAGETPPVQETAAASPATSGAPDPAKGLEVFSTICIACHGPDGNSIIPNQPSLAGQHPEYLLKQLTEFRSGKRANAIMNPFANLLSEQDIQNVVAWVSTQKYTPNAARDKEYAAQQASQIWFGGVAGRKVAACSGCHTPSGMGIPSQYPRLAGQHPDYTEAQLTTFRNGQRANNDVMTDVAARLTDAEIRALADFIGDLGAALPKQ